MASHLENVVRDVIQLIKAEINSNLEILPSAEIAGLPDPPGVTLSEPVLSLNLNKTKKDKTSVEDEANGTYKEYEPPKAYDIEFELMLVENSSPELLNMTHKAMVFFDRNAMTNLDNVDYPLNLVSQFSPTTKPNLTNYHVSTGRFQVEGVLVESGDFESGHLVQTVHWQYDDIEGNKKETKSFDEGGRL